MKEGNQQFEEVAEAIFMGLVDSMIVDVASESHRAARLGMDPRLNIDEDEELQLAIQARAASTSGSETSSKQCVDIFGQKHPAIASEVLECMNCKRNIVAGRFAPHLVKCMGKGRKVGLRTLRNMSMQQGDTVRSSNVPSKVPRGTSQKLKASVVTKYFREGAEAVAKRRTRNTSKQS